jgi:zinc/manganese transport system substrate-binding protein
MVTDPATWAVFLFFGVRHPYHQVSNLRAGQGHRFRMGARVLAAALSLGVAVLASACSSASGAATSGSSAAGDAIVAVGAENEYANVIAQVGGKYVQASAIMSNPNTDLHTFEASPLVAREVNAA